MKIITRDSTKHHNLQDQHKHHRLTSFCSEINDGNIQINHGLLLPPPSLAAKTGAGTAATNTHNVPLLYIKENNRNTFDYSSDQDDSIWSID